MHKAIVHIGTEKTGSTAIQNFLYKNEKILAQYGHYFPWRTCGLISNFRLAIYACNQADDDLLAIERHPLSDDPDAAYKNNPDAWRKKFTDVHLEQVRNIHKKHIDSTVLYSSEHFHSRILHQSEVERLRDFLDQIYDSVQIIVYFRRQDRLAVSGHNTCIQGGSVDRFKFPDEPDDLNYFDYLSLVKRWSAVFGDEKITVRIFEKDRLVGQDVGHDFKANTLSADVLGSLEDEPLQYERSNPRLSYTALEVLMAFNRLPNNDSLLQGVGKGPLRQPLIFALHELKDEYGEMLPARESAMRYYDKYRADNQTLFDRWGDGQSFGENFSMFPEDDSVAPDLDTDGLLSQYLGAVIAQQSA